MNNINYIYNMNNIKLNVKVRILNMKVVNDWLNGNNENNVNKINNMNKINYINHITNMNNIKLECES